ncbi:MAG TPA: response regulator transcription factor [Ktedonobacteraceae bacterium]|nr:response regulator transcription factor [Ktedonobacteraceae bacterium]
MSYLRVEQEAENDFTVTRPADVLLSPVTVLIVDDHALVRAAISQVLSTKPEIKLVVTAQNYAEAEAQTAKLHLDIIWLDMHVAHSDSLAEIRRLRKLSPDSRIIALADVENEQEAFAAIMAGAQGYRSKQDVDLDDIMTMIHAVYRDEFVLRPELLTRLMQRLRTAALPLWGSENGTGNHVLLRDKELNSIEHLTTREREILQLISQGYRDRDVAEGLHISEKTVQKHVQNILSKLGAQNRTEAAYLIHHHAAS